MTFITKLDYSNNRQIKQHIETLTVLSGASAFGVSFSGLPSGVDTTTTGITETHNPISYLSTFSGNGSTTNYTWYDSRMQLGASALSVITLANSGITQTTGQVYVSSSATTIDGNNVNLAYTGVSFNVTPIIVITGAGGTYSGTVKSDFLYILSANSLDFKSRCIWVDVSGMTRTQDLIITNSPVVGYIWTCLTSEGKGYWAPTTGGTDIDTQYWISGTTGTDSIKANNGVGTDANGNYAISEGYSTKASGNTSHAEGWFTIAQGDYSHAEGYITSAIGLNSHAEGNQTTASGDTSHAEGQQTIASGNYSHAEGNQTTASGNTSHAEGYKTIASGIYSHAEGGPVETNGPIAYGQASHAEGTATVASGSSSHSEGNSTMASGYVSHAEGYGTIASGDVSHAEGYGTIASGQQAHAEGYYTIASGQQAHAEGYYTIASNTATHAGGENSIASGINSFVHGVNSLASGTNTIVLGANLTGATSGYTYVGGLNIGTLHATGGTEYGLYIDSSGNVGSSASDVRLKKNIVTIDNALEKIKQLRGVSFNWKNGNDTTRLGFIAQEINNVIPELTFINNKTMGVHYDMIAPLLVEAIKELSSGVTTTGNVYLETQTIFAEDNDIQLNYSGTHLTAIGGGVKVLHAMGQDEAAIFAIDSDGNWITNNDLKSKALTIPEYTPSSTVDTNGNIGNITRDDSYLYIKTKNGWMRSNLESF